ncbi:MAG: hypothetical protein ACPLTR_00375 [Thermacetogeniaceae bacterium]
MGANERCVDNEFNLLQERSSALNKLKEELARRAAEFMKDSNSKPAKMGYTQIRNLVALAQMASTPLEITAFIDYQMGRDDKEESWRCRVGGQPFGEALKQEIRAVESIALQKRQNDEKFALLCLAQFFGYLAWRAKYLEYAAKKSERAGGEQRGGRR